jgi:hypothetical protein
MARIEMKPQVEIVFQLWFVFMVLRRILEDVSLSVARKPLGPSNFFRQTSTTYLLQIAAEDFAASLRRSRVLSER